MFVLSLQWMPRVSLQFIPLITEREEHEHWVGVDVIVSLGCSSGLNSRVCRSWSLSISFSQIVFPGDTCISTSLVDLRV